MSESTTIPQAQKLVVLFNGQRVSRVVHEGANAAASADAERNSYISTLVESTDAAKVEIKQLLMG